MNNKKAMILSVSILAVCAGILFALSAYDSSISDNKNNDGLHIKGHIHAVLTDINGNVKQTIDKDNLIVSNGFKGIAKLGWNANSGVSASTYRYIALGTSSTAANSADTTLGVEVSAGGYSRQLTTAPTYSAGVITLTGVFTGFSCTCVEMGVFDASTSGDMLARQTYSAINIGSSDTLTVTYTDSLS